MEDENKPTKQLKKHTAMVHCSNTLTLLQRKISNALLFHAFDDLKTKGEHQIRVLELCKLIGYQGHNQEVIKDALRALTSTSIEWNLVDQNTDVEDWTASSVLASVNLKGSLCTYEYSNRMRELLHMPTMFAKINLFIQSHFRSSYGLALYENCIRYHGLPVTRWFDIELFRKMMGVSDKQYLAFCDFKKRVLDQAVYEVNSYSNIFIESEIFRKGRKVVKLRFHLKERSPRKILGGKKETSDVKNSSLTDILIDIFNLKADRANELILQYGEEYLNEKINLIRTSKQFLKGEIKNISGLLIDAIISDYKPTNGFDYVKSSSLKKEKDIQIGKQLQEKRHHYNKYLRNAIYKKFIEPGPEEKLFEEFALSLQGSLYEGILKREGMNNILIQDQFVNFIKENERDRLNELNTFEEYCAEEVLT